jgi:hypothetical protein
MNIEFTVSDRPSSDIRRKDWIDFCIMNSAQQVAETETETETESDESKNSKV